MRIIAYYQNRFKNYNKSMSDFRQQSCQTFILVYHEMFLRFTLSVALHTHLLSEEKYWVRQKMIRLQNDLFWFSQQVYLDSSVTVWG